MDQVSLAVRTRRPLPVNIVSNDIQVLYSEHILGFRENWLQHSFFKLVIIDGGSGIFEVACSQNGQDAMQGAQSHRVARGDMILIPHSSTHRWLDAADDPLRLLIVCCENSCIDADILDWCTDARCLRLSDERQADRRVRLGHQLIHEYSRQQPAWRGQIVALVHSELIQVMRYYVSDVLSPRQQTVGLYDQQMLQLRQYFETDYHQTLVIDDLAERCGMSCRNFTKHFRQYFGMSAQHYQRHIRMQMAQDLLRSGLPIIQVALELGYCDASNFHKAFSQVFGCSPKKWLASGDHRCV